MLSFRLYKCHLLDLGCWKPAIEVAMAGKGRQCQPLWSWFRMRWLLGICLHLSPFLLLAWSNHSKFQNWHLQWFSQCSPLDQQHQRHMGACEKCQFSGPTPDGCTRAPRWVQWSASTSSRSDYEAQVYAQVSQPWLLQDRNSPWPHSYC